MILSSSFMVLLLSVVAPERSYEESLLLKKSETQSTSKEAILSKKRGRISKESQRLLF